MWNGGMKRLGFGGVYCERGEALHTKTFLKMSSLIIGKSVENL